MNEDSKNMIPGREGAKREAGEDALRESEERYRNLYETIAKGIIYYDADGRVLSANPAAQRIMGLPENEMKGRAIEDSRWKAIHEDGSPYERNEHPARRALDEGTEICNVIMGVFNPTAGEHRWIMVDSIPQYRKGERRAHEVFTTFDDVTELRKTQEALRNEKEFSDSVINSLPGVFYATDQNFRALRWNRNSEIATGYSHEEIQTMTVTDFVPEEERQQVREALMEADIIGEICREFHMRTRAGDLIPYLLTAKRLMFGKQKVFIGVGFDITERNRTEEELRRLTDELKRSNEDLQQFAFVASHDLQSPLAGIEGFVKLLEKRCHERADPKADELMGHVLTSIESMRRLITDLLDFSKVQAGDATFEPVAIGECIENALMNLQPVVQEKKPEITVDEKLPTVFGDHSQLSRLFQNLIGNALKFSGEKPVIRISWSGKGNKYLFSVEDNGIGVSPEYREKIFGAFQRLHGKGKYSGSGLGLAICRRIVERHGGRIWLKSEPGKGATFFLTLPKPTTFSPRE